MVAIGMTVGAACGGGPKPPPVAPLADDAKPAEVAPAMASTADKPAPAREPPAAQQHPVNPGNPSAPIELKIPASQATVVLVSSGSGKKQAMRYTLSPGARQAIELAMDFAGKQDSDERVVPTIVLTGEAVTKELDRDGNAAFTVTVASTDARAVAGSQIPLDQFRQILGALSGLTIAGRIGPSGASSEFTLRLDGASPDLVDALDLLRLTLPRLPILPREPIGVGARWQATTATKLAERLDVTQVTDYQLVAHNGPVWTITGKIKIIGKDQELDSNRISGITGAGTSEATLAEGALYPTYRSSLETQFRASEKDKSTLVVIKIGSAVTPKR
jgi:hypothetical protein